MSTMSIPYEAGGRVQQKSRTRTALVVAAREMVSRGMAPSVAEAADAAAVSRTTAYRYFPNQRTLLAAAHPETGATSMLGDDPPEDVTARLDEVVRGFTAMIRETEAQQRTMLRLSLEDDPHDRGAQPLRQGRAIGWIAEALDPLRGQLPDDELHQLVLAIRSATGIEALVWLTDIGGMSRDAAAELMRWSAQSMLQAALSTGVPGSKAVHKA
ncbi:MAG: TetR family transcriptional regulator [Aeromicrobium sp.]|nr:TetR family transcriptional regulator [Aeromicrobium sp.]